jgi:hypothetical protein
MIMLELILVACVVLYLALSVWVVVLAGKWAKKRGRRRWPWCTAAGLFMYLLVAWEQIPTFVVGRYYCATQAGLTVYKTPEQWLAENPGVAEVLTWQKVSPSKSIGVGERDVFLNQRLIWSTRRSLNKLIPVNISTREIFDRENKEILVRQVTVSTGYKKRGEMGAEWNVLKILAGDLLCDAGYSNFLALVTDYAEIGREIKP